MRYLTGFSHRAIEGRPDSRSVEPRNCWPEHISGQSTPRSVMKPKFRQMHLITDEKRSLVATPPPADSRQQTANILLLSSPDTMRWAVSTYHQSLEYYIPPVRNPLRSAWEGPNSVPTSNQQPATPAVARVFSGTAREVGTSASHPP